MTIQKVLVVDDSKTELMALSDILQKQGMQVRTAENGEEAMKRLAEDKPDLILIDGGKGQVASAFAALADLGLTHLPMIGVAKGEERKPGLETLIFPDEREPLQLPSAHPALHLIQEVRDEAHRFAITGHRAQRAG